MWFIILGIGLFVAIITYAICAAQPYNILDDTEQIKYLKEWRTKKEKDTNA